MRLEEELYLREEGLPSSSHHDGEPSGSNREGNKGMKFWEKQRMPQQSPQNASTPSSRTGNEALANCKSASDVFQVRLTIYELSGILCRTKQKKKRWHLKSSTSRQKNLAKAENCSSEETQQQLETSFDGTASLDSQSQEEPPTTAVISYSSNNAGIATFLPSMALEKQTEEDGVTNCSASWVEKGCKRDHEHNHHASVVQLRRVMKRKPHSEYDVNDDNAKPSYIPQIVKFGLFVGKASELIPLGVAKFMLTGEEESEELFHIPVMRSSVLSQSGPPNHPRRKQRSRKHSKPCFSRHPRQRFMLDENGVLRVGVQVFPVEERSTQQQPKPVEEDVDQIINLLDHLFDESNGAFDPPRPKENLASESKRPMAYEFPSVAYEDPPVWLESCDESDSETEVADNVVHGNESTLRDSIIKQEDGTETESADAISGEYKMASCDSDEEEMNQIDRILSLKYRWNDYDSVLRAARERMRVTWSPSTYPFQDPGEIGEI